MFGGLPRAGSAAPRIRSRCRIARAPWKRKSLGNSDNMDAIVHRDASLGDLTFASVLPRLLRANVKAGTLPTRLQNGHINPDREAGRLFRDLNLLRRRLARRQCADH